MKSQVSNGHTDYWAKQGVKDQTMDFIDHIYVSYYKSYEKESDFFENIGNWLYMGITVIGFLVTILIGLQKILVGYITPLGEVIITICVFILPSLSSVLLLYMNQKGFKKKLELREKARIYSKYLINNAKIQFAAAVSDEDYKKIYLWLNDEIKKLQESQVEGYIEVHNITEN